MPALPVLAAVVTLAGLSVLAATNASGSAPPGDAARRGSPSAASVAVGAAGPPLGPRTTRAAAPAAPGRAGLSPVSARVHSAYRWPLSPPPAVLRRFVVGPERWSPGHRGVDLAAAAGDDVLAAAPGVVSFAGMVAGRGVVAVLHADGIRTTYEPVAATVPAGEAVAGGAPLGRLAPGQHCAGSCLHWGALRGDTYLDPLSLLAPPAPPVLLPLGTAGTAP